MTPENRYSRQLVLAGFGEAAQQLLGQAKVLVIGAGGLGVPVLQYLAGMGVGTLGIADGDRVRLSNLHRQVLYATADVGSLKVIVAAERLSALNPEVRIITFDTDLTPSNAMGIIADFDLVVDATDNFGARYLINDACVLLGRPFVYGAVHQYEGHVSVFNYRDGPTYRCLYPVQPSDLEIPDCNTAGVLGIAPGIIGCQQALEAVKVITGIGTVMSGFLQVFDILSSSQYTMKLKTRPESRRITELQESYAVPSCFQITDLEPSVLADWVSTNKSFMLLDVREPGEYEGGHLMAAVSVPLSRLYDHIAELPRNTPLVTVCEQGGRSRKAAAGIQEKVPGTQVYSVQGGMRQWRKQFGTKHIVT